MRRGRSGGFTTAGVLALVYMVGMTAWGYRSWLPVLLVAATAVLVVVVALGTRQPEERSGA
jgi:hypothetical protein